MKIAIIEDNPIFRNIQKSSLSKDFIVDVFVNCEDFFCSGLNNKYDLLLVDRHFDNCKGEHDLGDAFDNKFIARIKNSPNMSAKIILWTNDAPDELEGSGFDKVLCKNIYNKDEIKSVLDA